MRLFFLILLLLAPSLAVAQSISPGSACSTSGDTAMSSGSNSNIGLLYCNGSTWVSSSVVATGSVTTCDSTTAGTFKLNGSTLQFCNGSSWGSIAKQALKGNFVALLDVGRYQSDFGSLAGANALCRSQLAAKGWWGKPTTLDTNKVFAFLCDSTSCNNLQPNTTYYFGAAFYPNIGGASFTTDSSGNGPNNTESWADSSHFINDNLYFFGRNSASASAWTSSPSSYTCNNWGTGSGAYGAYLRRPNSSGSVDVVYDCSTPAYLICFVNP